MLLCNNTAIRRARLIKDAGRARAGLSVRPYGPILARMSEADDVARRFIAIWGDYLAALTADPKMAEPLHRWLGLVVAAMPGSPAREAAPVGSARSPADATASAGASGERD